MKALRCDRGISLIELLVAIAVLGVLASIVVFSVRGTRTDASAAACTADARVVSRAQDAFHAQHGRYATESDLVAGGALRRQSTFHDITLEDDDFAIVPLAPCGSNVPTPTSGPGPANTVVGPPATPSASTTTTTSPTTTIAPTTIAPTTIAPTTIAPTTIPATTSTTFGPTPSTSLPTASPATHLLFTVQPSNTPSRAVMLPAVVVTVRNASGEIVESSTAPLTIALTAGSGSPAGRIVCDANTKAATAGVVTFTGCIISKSATGYSLTASSPGLTGVTSTTFNVT